MVATTNAIAKIAAVVAGLGLVAMSFASFAAPAKAATADELQAQINALLAQIAAMNGGSSSASATFTMDLTLGSSGAEVTALQNWLIKGGYAIPAGATGYFGAQTQSALAAWQKANGVTPAAGYFGPVTRAKVNAMAGGSTGSTGGSTSGLGGGEASLEDFNSKSGDDDTVDENGSGEVAVFDFDVRDGDVKIERVDLSFAALSTNDELNPWDTFDTVTLKVNGKEVASEDVSDEDNWLENDSATSTFRFSGLNTVVKEDDNAEIVVEVETQNGIDGVANGENWTVFIGTDDVRAIDGAGIDQYTGSATEDISFDIQAEGGDDELSIRSSTDDPDATTLKVETSQTSDWYTVFVFDLEADDQGGDIDVDQLGVNFNTSDNLVSDVVNDVKIVIDGEEFTDFDWATAVAASRKATFNVDKDFTIASGERVPVEVMAKFKAVSAYTAGTTIAASTTGAIITAEGADDLTATGASTGETHTLQTSGINVEAVDSGFSAVTTAGDAAGDDYGTFKVKVDITAFEEDIFISQTAALAFTSQFENASNAAVIATSSTADASSTTMSISTTADTDNGQYRINEGDTESFTFTTTIDPGNAHQGKSIRMQLLSINFGNDNVNVEESSWSAAPAADYETDGTLINN